MPESPQSPITELAAMAAQNHELFTAYVEAGFTEPQAMQLLVAFIQVSLFGGAQ